MKKQSIGDVCNIRNGFAFKSSDFQTTGIPIVRIGEIKDGKVDTSKSPFVARIEKYAPYILSKGDILIAMSGATTGKIGIFEIDEDAYQNQRVGCFKPDKSKLNNEYLFHYLQSISTLITKKAYGGGQPNISTKEIEKFKIPLPSTLTEQKKIAKVLSDTKQLISLRKESIALLDEFLKSTFLEMFGDPVSNDKKWDIDSITKAVVDIKSGTSYGGEENNEIASDELGVLKISAVTKGEFNPNEYKSVKKKDIKKNLITVTEGMFLLSRANTKELVAACCIVPQDYPYLFIPDKLWSLIIDEGVVNKIYLNYLLKNENYRNLIRKKASGGHDSMLNISMKKFRSLKLPIPPDEIQSKFAQIVEKTEVIKKHYQENLQELENLYGSLSQRAFKGELDLSKVNVDKEVNIEKILNKIEDIESITDLELEKIKSKNKLIESKIDNATEVLADKEVPKKIKSYINLKKLIWEDISIERVSSMIIEKYSGYHFTIEMLVNFLKKEKVLVPKYFSSKELKINPQLNSKEDIKNMIFTSIVDDNGGNENPYIKLKQVFYNSEKENFVLNLTEEDFQLLKEKPNHSGIYLSVYED